MVEFEAYPANKDDLVLQGDIFKNVSYVYKTQETEDYVDFTEFEFPYIVVLSQSCDVSAMSKLIIEGGKTIKFMPSVLVAPIYDKDALKNGEIFEEILKSSLYDMNRETLFSSKKHDDIIKNDDHYRFQMIMFKEGFSPLDFKSPIIDFKHYFSVSPEYLNNIKDSKRVCHLEQLYCEQITLRFANFLSRIAFPD